MQNLDVHGYIQNTYTATPIFAAIGTQNVCTRTHIHSSQSSNIFLGDGPDFLTTGETKGLRQLYPPLLFYLLLMGLGQEGTIPFTVCPAVAVPDSSL